MSVPFSNTSLRVPRGFGNILEGLAREVLREQPEDIPRFAAVYFTALLKQREESGLDPAEWGARLEDRFYNNHAFKDTATRENSNSRNATRSSVNEDKADQAESLENGDTIIQPTQSSSPSSEIPDASKDEEKLVPHQNNELKVDDESGETDPETAAEISYRGTADVDICAEELQEMKINEHNETGDADADKDICATELEPTPLSSYPGLAEVDVCAEELEQSTLQKNEDTESSRDMIDASLGGASESLKPALSEEELSESQDLLHTHEKLNQPSAESLGHIEQDAAKELNDISNNENPVVLPVEEEEGTGDQSEDAQNTLSEMTDALLKEPEEENSHVEQLSLNKEAESITVPDEENTYDDTITEKEEVRDTENQDSKDTLTEAMDESFSSLDKENSNSAGAEVEHFVNIASEIQKENSDDCDYASQSEPIAEAVMSTDRDQGAFDMQEDMGEDNNEETHLHNLQTSSDAVVEKSEDLESNMIGTTTEEVKEGDVRISQQELPKFDDAPGSGDEEETEIKEDHLFDDINTQEAEIASHSHTLEQTEVILADSQELKTEETETYLAQEQQSDHQKDINQEDEEKEMENPESKSDQQEECSHPQEEEDIMDIPLDDPEANKAAAKIQAGFRGHMTRKKLKPGDKPGEEVSSSGEALNGSQGDTAGGSEGVETDDTSVPEQ